jgi:hypothetical protein
VAATAAALIVPGILSAQGASAATEPGILSAQGPFGTIARNWGGDVMTFVNPDPQNDPLGASAIWTVPAVSCTHNGQKITNKVGVWVGLGGDGVNDLEQTGTADQCTNGVASYWPFYDFTGCTSTSQCVNGNGKAVDLSKRSKYVPTPFHIYKGDNMAANVAEQGPGYFVTQLWDHGSAAHPTNTWYTDWIFDTTDGEVPTTAEWIVEDQNVYETGGQLFPKYSPAVLFQNCYWYQDGGTSELGSAPGGINSINAYTDSVQVTNTSSLYSDNMSFSVAWANWG